MLPTSDARHTARSPLADGIDAAHPTPNGRQGKRAVDLPVTYLGAVLGLGGLGNGWRAAHRVWGAPAIVGDIVSLVAVAIWAICTLLFLWSWWRAYPQARADARDPTRIPFAALLPMSTIVAAIALRPHARVLADAIAVVGLSGALIMGIAVTAGLWRGTRTSVQITPILLMPTVGGFFLASIAARQIDDSSLAVLFFGAALISWMVTESIVLRRLATDMMPPDLRATIGIHLTPPAIACVAYLGLADARPDPFAQMIFGYGLFQGLVALWLVVWLREQTFSHRAWSYTFGVSALPLAALRFVELGGTGTIAALAAPLFIGANLVIGWIALRAAGLAFRRATSG